MNKYILNGHVPERCEDIATWGKWFESADRHVAETTIGDIRISTVFLGIDHAWGGGAPVLFETMIFGGEHDGYQDRCSTWERAEEMHKQAVKIVENSSDVPSVVGEQ